MNLSETMDELDQKYPKRQPGSADSSAVFEQIKEIAANWGVPVESQTVPNYNFSTSIWVFAIGSLITIALSQVQPFLGLILTTLLWLLLVGEVIQPILARIKPAKAQNLAITIPARSKESQKIIIMANLSTDHFIAKPFKMSTRNFIGFILGLGLATVILFAIGLLARQPIYVYLSTLPSLGMIICNLVPKEIHHANGLSNCSILLELGSMLIKAHLNTTTVILYFIGSQSLNSGVLKVPKLLNKNSELNYVIHILDLKDKRINLITADGPLIPQTSDPLLIESFMEVAKEKTISLQAIKRSEIDAITPLKAKGIKAISVANPLGSAEDNKDLRELLIGLIRKLDH